MEFEKYTQNTISVSAILGNIMSKDIVIPEIQRPFVWKKTQVRDFRNSLYKGYPTGYLVTWRNPNIKLKDGGISSGKKIMIDGQQRVTALMTAILGIEVINTEYKKESIKIAFNPFEALSGDKEAEIFQVQDQSHLKSKKWIANISEVFKNDFSSLKFIKDYCSNNPDMTEDDLDKALTKLKAIGNRQIGVIELSENLDIDIVTDIFIRINSRGTPLSQGDFVMSKIAADEKFGGNTLRKAIDYFSHLCVMPAFYEEIRNNDLDFYNTEYMKKMLWMKDENDSVYDPNYADVIRVAFMHKFDRAKLADLVSLLSGRDFKSRDYKEEIAEESFAKLKDGVINFINKNNFMQFLIAIKSAGFISEKLINSNMALDFAYTLFLILMQTKEVSVSEIKRIVQKWYVLSILTGRYSSSPESAFNRDLRQIKENGVVQTLRDIEAAILSDSFWNVALVQNLCYTSTNNPTYLVYLAAQVSMNDISLLSNNTSVRYLIELAGDVHHIFPKAYLKKNGFEKDKYNQGGNYAFLDSQVNKSIGEKPPKNYLNLALEQCETKNIVCGSITDKDELIENLKMNCIPQSAFDMDFTNYEDFLEERRKLMAAKIKKFYMSL